MFIKHNRIYDGMILLYKHITCATEGSNTEGEMKKEYNEIKQLIKKYGPKIATTDDFRLREDLKAKQIKNALSNFAPETDESNIIALYDTTIGNSGKEGYLFTAAGIYIKEILTKPYYLKYSDIATIKQHFIGKKDCNDEVTIQLKDGTKLEITSVYLNKTPLCHFIEEIIKLHNQGKLAETDKVIPIEDMDDRVKAAYIDYIVSFANVDNEITGKELNRIYSLMVKVDAKTEIRQKIMFDMLKEKNISALLETIYHYAPQSSHRALQISLIRELLILSGSSYAEIDGKQKEFLKRTESLFNITEQEISLIQRTIDLENQFISGSLDEKSFMKSMQIVGETAASIGFPVAAVYMSGSVVGLSAAGITSGLSALGLGGVLGLSSMVTGIGAIALIGVAAGAGAKKVIGVADEKKQNKRDYLMAEAVKKNQETIAALLDDVNYLIDEITLLLESKELNENRIIEITKKYNLLKNAFKERNKTSDEQSMIVYGS